APRAPPTPFPWPPPAGTTNAVLQPCRRSGQGSLPRAHPGPSFVSDHRSVPAVGEGPIVTLGVKRPHVEVFDPGCPVQIVTGGPLAQRPAQQSACIPSRAVRVPLEKPGLCPCREFRKTDQV